MMRYSEKAPVRWPLTMLSFQAVAVIGIAVSVADVRLGLGAALVAGAGVMVMVIRTPDLVLGRSALLGIMAGIALSVMVTTTF